MSYFLVSLWSSGRDRHTFVTRCPNWPAKLPGFAETFRGARRAAPNVISMAFFDETLEPCSLAAGALRGDEAVHRVAEDEFEPRAFETRVVGDRAEFPGAPAVTDGAAPVMTAPRVVLKARDDTDEVAFHWKAVERGRGDGGAPRRGDVAVSGDVFENDVRAWLKPAHGDRREIVMMKDVLETARECGIGLSEAAALFDVHWDRAKSIGGLSRPLHTLADEGDDAEWLVETLELWAADHPERGAHARA